MVDDNNQDFLDGYEEGLCIPQDRLEDIDFFPDFNHDFITSSQLLEYLTSIDDTLCDQESGDVESHDNHGEILSSLDSQLSNSDYDTSSQEHDEREISFASFFTTKKPRTKTPRKGNRNSMSSSQLKTKKSRKENRNSKSSSLAVRLKTEKKRCYHCHAERTPLWRLGPMGPNTLCNACGLTYKSGRLVPEYRPAASPSFNSVEHSNFYRRIKQKKLREKEYGEVMDEY